MELYGYEIQREKDISHYGILGMKWGVRRWQGYDGSFNAAGIERYFGRKPGQGSVAAELGKKAVHDPSKYSGKPVSSEKSDRYRKKSAEAQKKVAELKEYGTDSETFKKAYAYADKMSDTAFYLSYGATKNKAVKDLIKYNEHRVVKFNKKADRVDGKHIQKVLNCSPEQAKQIHKVSKIIGISLATTAGLVAAGYLLRNKDLITKIIENPNAYFQFLDGNYNSDIFRALRPIKLDNKLFSNAFNGDYIGKTALANGFREISGRDLKAFMENPMKYASEWSIPINKSIDFDNLVKNVRVNQISNDAGRRLSCWSAANSFFMSAMTGGNFASKSFENLVDFNDFGKLFIKKPKIFNFDGSIASDFVGKFGQLEARANEATARSLINSIFGNISSANNLAIDGKTTVGFINAGYHSATCTHQWNFELKNVGEGLKELFISDGYSGDRYKVGQVFNNNISYDGLGLNKFMEELHHYNESSIRYYAPSLKSFNPTMVANILLMQGK